MAEEEHERSVLVGDRMIRVTRWLRVPWELDFEPFYEYQAWVPMTGPYMLGPSLLDRRGWWRPPAEIVCKQAIHKAWRYARGEWDPAGLRLMEPAVV